MLTRSSTVMMKKTSFHSKTEESADEDTRSLLELSPHDVGMFWISDVLAFIAGIQDTRRWSGLPRSVP